MKCSLMWMYLKSYYWSRYLLVNLWLQRVLMHWGSESCRLGSITFRLIGSWWTSQLGFLQQTQQRRGNESLQKQRRGLWWRSDGDTADGGWRSMMTGEPSKWKRLSRKHEFPSLKVDSCHSTVNTDVVQTGTHLFSALVRLPVHSLTSRGHSHGHSHSFCSILRKRKTEQVILKVFAQTVSGNISEKKNAENNFFKKCKKCWNSTKLIKFWFYTID